MCTKHKCRLLVDHYDEIDEEGRRKVGDIFYCPECDKDTREEVTNDR